jgi:uncharacterized repeat protein (TIGR03803 family)
MKSHTWMWMTVVYLFAALAMALVAIQSAQAQAFSVIYNFTGGSDGANPSAGLTIDAAGNFYGTNNGGSGFGTVFKLKRSGSSWTLAPLYSFQQETDGDQLEDVIIGPNGSLYGTTFSGGKFYDGTVYNLSPPAGICQTVSCPWTHTLLYNFTGGSDGGYPAGPLVFDQAGNIYGTTWGGGSGGDGTVFELDTLGNETVLHSFAGADGYEARSGLIKDEAGNLYGTTYIGGRQIYCPPSPVGGCGTVFELDTTGRFIELYLFSTPPDGAYPVGVLVRDKAGNLYGTTLQGGTGPCSFYNGRRLIKVGCGTVFKLDTAGHESILYSFLGGSDGQGPLDGLVMDAAGSLYGITNGSGPGTVFKVDALGNETVLHRFTGSDGANPQGHLVFDANGNLYGTTYHGGTGSNCYEGYLGCGVVFKITP